MRPVKQKNMGFVCRGKAFALLWLEGPGSGDVRGARAMPGAMELIRTLSEQTISQIAAGEVVERPAHLVKELIENSFDAGASEIELDFSDGGRYVRARDNGRGIPSDQMSLALARHATSKIQKTEDLWRLKSYGFRGEALASIASVSDLSLISQMKGENSSRRLRSRFGKTARLETIGGIPGTTVIVKSLFENVPARLKFLKSPAAEGAAIKTAIKAMSLSRPDVSFRILQGGRLLFYWPAAKSLAERARQILGEKELYWTEGRLGAYRMEAVIAAPNKTFRNRKSVWLFICGRYVESRVMQAALMSAFRGLLMHGEYPLAVVKADGPGEEIDVNVHPAKSQARFKDSSVIFKLVERPIRQLLEQAPWTRAWAGADGQAEKPAGLAAPKSPSFNEENLKFQSGELETTRFPRPESPLKSSAFQLQKRVLKNNGGGLAAEDYKPLSWPPEGAAPAGAAGAPPQSAIQSNPESAPFVFSQNPQLPKTGKSRAGFSWASLQVLAQAHLTYLVCQSDKAIMFIDQHAAHERVLYERLLFSWKKGAVDVQKLLIPFALDLEEDQFEALFSLRDSLLSMGLTLEQLGPSSAGVTAAPAILKEKAMQEGLLFLAKEAAEKGGSFAFEKAVSDLSATMACHSAIRAGQALDEARMRELLKSMDEFPLSGFCPHGRPVFVEYPIARLEREFCRTV